MRLLMSHFEFDVAFAIFPLVVTILLFSWKMERLDALSRNEFWISCFIGIRFVFVWVSATWFGAFNQLSEKGQ